MTHVVSSQLHHSLELLYRRAVHGIKLDLVAITNLLGELGNPQHAYPVIHVAGTNGKGSVCAMVEAVLRTAGYRTGLYTSPHLTRFNERFRINGTPIDDETLSGQMEAVESADARSAVKPGSRPASFFECSTAIAFRAFRDASVEVAVIETGLGGRLDATNVVDPLVSVITSIDFDHTQYLGETVEQVAMEKGGIIKKGKPVVLGQMEDRARAELRRLAAERGSPVVDADPLVSIELVSSGLHSQRIEIETSARRYPAIDFPLLGRHQLDNCATAVVALERLAQVSPLMLTEGDVCAGLESVKWPGRCELVSSEPPILVDAAHNPAGARALAATLRDAAGEKPIGLLLGISAEKDAAGFLRELEGLPARLWGVQMNHERGMPVDELRKVFAGTGGDVTIDRLAPQLEEAKRWAAEKGAVLCIAGSVFLAGEALELFQAPGSG